MKAFAWPCVTNMMCCLATGTKTMGQLIMDGSYEPKQTFPLYNLIISGVLLW
jgi:hypothetical protein